MLLCGKLTVTGFENTDISGFPRHLAILAGGHSLGWTDLTGFNYRFCKEFFVRPQMKIFILFSPLCIWETSAIISSFSFSPVLLFLSLHFSFNFFISLIILFNFVYLELKTHPSANRHLAQSPKLLQPDQKFILSHSKSFDKLEWALV